MWYSARLLYESVLADETLKKDVLFEEKIIVFYLKEAADFDAKLARLCRAEELGYENVEGNLLRWVFREVLEVQEIMADEITDGTEVFFRFWDKPGVRAFKTMRETHMEPWWPRHPEKPGPPT